MWWMKMQAFNIAYVGVVLWAVRTEVAGNRWNEADLLAHLLNDYNNQVRPVRNASEQVMVGLGLQYHQLLNVNEKEQVMSSILWLSSMWNDDYFKWNETETGIGQLVVPADIVWVPDVFISNLADEAKSTTEALLGRKEPAMFYPDGTVIHYMPFRVETTCKLNMINFPFDRQYCPIQIGSWGYDQDQLDIYLTAKAEISKYGEIDTPSSNWIIVRITDKFSLAHYVNPYFKYKQQLLTFTVVLDRRSSATIAYTIVPCVMLDIIVIFSFLLPIRSEERISLGLTAFLAYSVYLLIIADKLPEASDNLPTIAVIFLFFMGVTLVSIIWSICVSIIELEGSKYDAPPKCLMAFAQCLSQSKNSGAVKVISYTKAEDTQQVPSNTPQDHGNDSLTIVGKDDVKDGGDHSEDWNLIVKGIDKVLFVAVALHLIISGGAFVASVAKTD